MSAPAYELLTEITVIDDELTELATRLRTSRKHSEHAELLWERVDRLLDRRITLTQQDSAQAWWPDE